MKLLHRQFRVWDKHAEFVSSFYFLSKKKIVFIPCFIPRKIEFEIDEVC